MAVQDSERRNRCRLRKLSHCLLRCRSCFKGRFGASLIVNIASLTLLAEILSKRTCATKGGFYLNECNRTCCIFFPPSPKEKKKKIKRNFRRRPIGYSRFELKCYTRARLVDESTRNLCLVTRGLRLSIAERKRQRRRLWRVTSKRGEVKAYSDDVKIGARSHSWRRVTVCPYLSTSANSAITLCACVFVFFPLSFLDIRSD
jgi:hypothetical protein